MHASAHAPLQRFLRFSRTLKHHTAAMSLFVAFHNFVRIHGARRVTPAMEAGITDHVWTVEELVDRALAAAAEPVAKPEKKPLRLPETPAEVPAAPVRETGSAPAPKAPPPAPIPTPAALAAQVPEPPKAWEQLDLLAWRPPTREPVQLKLFREDE